MSVTRTEHLSSHRVAALTLAALVLGLTRSFVFGGQVLYKRDIHLFFQPRAETLVRMVHSGSWPVWNPYGSFGQPFSTDPSTKVFYPFTWLNFIVQP